MSVPSSMVVLRYHVTGCLIGWLRNDRVQSDIGHGKVVRRINENLDNYCVSVFVYFWE